MNVYHLFARPDAPHKRHATHGWDCVRGFVVIAESEMHARRLVGQYAVCDYEWKSVLNGCGAECHRGVCLDQAGREYLRGQNTIEGPCVWRDALETACLPIGANAHGEPRIVLRDYSAG